MPSEEETKLAMDERKRKRMISNRESARRSRMRKQQCLEDLINQVAQLKNENNQILKQINLLTPMFLGLDGENNVLRAQIMELTERLKSLNSVLQFVNEFGGMAMDIPEIPDPNLKPWQLPCLGQPIMPWQLPCLGQPIMASANLFQF